MYFALQNAVPLVGAIDAAALGPFLK